MHSTHKLYLAVIVLLITALACDISPRTDQPVEQPAEQGAVETQVAQTVDAQGAVQTQVAQTVAAQGPAPSDTPQPTAEISTEDTPEADAPEPTATFTPEPTEEYKPVIGVRDLNLGGPDELYEFEIEQLMFDYAGSNDRAEFKDGRFVFEIDDPISFDIWTYSWIEDQNFYVELTIEMPDPCRGQDRAGFIFRTPQNTYDLGYVFQISCSGEYRLTFWDGAVHNDLISWVSNSNINSGNGAINRVGIWAKGNTYRLFVNAVEVGSYNDNTLLGVGKIGLVIGVESTQNYQVKFDDFAYWDLP